MTDKLVCGRTFAPTIGMRYAKSHPPDSVANPYGRYGSPYSSQSPKNPYATQAPLLFGD